MQLLTAEAWQGSGRHAATKSFFIKEEARFHLHVNNKRKRFNLDVVALRQKMAGQRVFIGHAYTVSFTKTESVKHDMIHLCEQLLRFCVFVLVSFPTGACFTVTVVLHLFFFFSKVRPQLSVFLRTVASGQSQAALHSSSIDSNSVLIGI